MVSPRKSRKKSLYFSRTVTATPWRARRKPSMMPAGPPPGMQQLGESWVPVGLMVGLGEEGLENASKEVGIAGDVLDSAHSLFFCRKQLRILRFCSCSVLAR